MKRKQKFCLHCGKSFWLPKKKQHLFLFCSKECIQNEKEKETTGIVLGKRPKPLWSKWKIRFTTNR